MTEKLPFVFKNGHRLVVGRPADPARALRRSREILERQEGSEAFQQMLFEQAYTFRGYLGVKGKIPYVCDGDGRVLEPTQPGDSFISELACSTLPPPKTPTA